MALTNKQKSYIRKQRGQKTARKLAGELKLDTAEVQAYLDELDTAEKNASSDVNSGIKPVFYLLMLAIPVLFFVLLEAGLRLAEYRGNLDLFAYPQGLEGEYGVPNPNFTARYFFNTSSVPSPSDDVFLTQKPEKGFRIVVMGGSTANGYPYGFNGSFSRVVRDVLQDVAPERKVEVINIATSAINTYSLYDQIDEVLEIAPDAIMIYSGHNEYYGALGVGSTETFGAFPGFIRSYLKLQRFKTFLLLRDGIVRLSGLLGTLTAPAAGAESGATLMQRMVGEQQITLDDEVYELGKLQFESNMSAILERFSEEEIPVFVGSLTSNLSDHEPFISIETEKHPAAKAVYEEARELTATEQHEQALEKYKYAKDLDALRFRAPEAFSNLLSDLTNQYENAFYVPVHERFQQESEHGYIGFNLMTEHLHPNLEGYHLMARAFTESYIDAGLPGLEADAQLSQLAGWDEYAERMEVTEFDRRVGEHRIMLLCNNWPFKEQRDPSGYPNNYEFTSPADSMAYVVVNDGERWDRAKVELAKIYEERDQPARALAEYEGLMRAQPFNDSPFVFAARIWLGVNNFDRARPLLEQAYEITPEAFTTKMLGAIEINAGNAERGVELLEESRELNPEDAQMLFNLSGGYAMLGEFQKADEVLRSLENLNPDFPGARAWRQQLNGHLARQNE
jgi:tetratricopeptide (TPR) repeat protein